MSKTRYFVFNIDESYTIKCQGFFKLFEILIYAIFGHFCLKKSYCNNRVAFWHKRDNEVFSADSGNECDGSKHRARDHTHNIKTIFVVQ